MNVAIGMSQTGKKLTNASIFVFNHADLLPNYQEKKKKVILTHT
jgi:hypothetical protein